MVFTEIPVVPKRMNPTPVSRPNKKYQHASVINIHAPPRVPKLRKEHRQKGSRDAMMATTMMELPPSSNTMMLPRAATLDSGNVNRFPGRQFLVRFDSKTHVITIDGDAQETRTGDTTNAVVIGRHAANRLLQALADRTGWNVSQLHIGHVGYPFVSVHARSSIRGGKGGFGTLLKGQSKQAGAKMTTDFGACRDLQGRRLRHVNDEIKLRKWRERQRREAAGEKVDADEMWKTPSGLYNWHLMTPTWADISKKATNKIKRQFKKMDQKLEREAAMKKEKDEAYQKTMTHYLDQTNSISESVQKNMSDAIKQGLAKKKQSSSKNAASSNKRKRTETSTTEDGSAYIVDGDEQPNSLVSLTGDAVVEPTPGTDSVKIQSTSEFMTSVFVMERRTRDEQSSPLESYYYEVTLVTGGLAQIGWACIVNNDSKGFASAFTPSNDLGDGVGDDSSSFAVDGSRGLKFHGGEEWKFPIEWKAGDRLGCRLTMNGPGGENTMSFTLNGNDLGVAFTDTDSESLVPAFSCNQGEILELHLTKEDCKFFPTDNATVVAVKDLSPDEPTASATEELDSTKGDGPSGNESESTPAVSTSHCTKAADGEDTKPAAASTKPPVAAAAAPPKEQREPSQPEPLDLDSYKSAEELRELGLDRLKSALLALNVKCGGTLEQRADRLFSLKGLDPKDFPMKVRAKGRPDDHPGGVVVSSCAGPGGRDCGDCRPAAHRTKAPDPKTLEHAGIPIANDERYGGSTSSGGGTSQRSAYGLPNPSPAWFGSLPIGPLRAADTAPNPSGSTPGGTNFRPWDSPLRLPCRPGHTRSNGTRNEPSRDPMFRCAMPGCAGLCCAELQFDLLCFAIFVESRPGDEETNELYGGHSVKMQLPVTMHRDETVLETNKDA
eukprot:jgi/Psemu1/1633/gm1.1633_g